MKLSDRQHIFNTFYTLELQKELIKSLDSLDKRSKTSLKSDLEKKFPFLDSAGLEFVISNFSSLRTELLRREVVSLQLPVKVSHDLNFYLFQKISKILPNCVIEVLVNSDISAGLKIIYKGKVFDWSLDHFLKAS